MKKILIVLVSFLTLLSAVSATAATVVSPNSLLVSTNDQIREYTLQGDLVQLIPIEYPGGYTVTEKARDIAYDPNGYIHVYNGTFTSYLSSYDLTSETWSHLTKDGFSTVNNITFGGIDIFNKTVFVTDMTTYLDGGEPNGIIAFNTETGESQRFAESIEPIDLTIGLNGLLYALSPGGSPSGRNIDVYDPVSLEHLESIFIAGITGVGGKSNRTIAVDQNGDIFVANNYGDVHHISADGKLIETINPICESMGPNVLCSFFDIDVSSDGKLALGTQSGDVFITDTSFSAISSFIVGAGQVFLEFPENPTLQVTIDIKPGNEFNFINLKSQSVTSIAILTTDSFDATEIDTATLGFGPNASPALQDKIFIKDVDGDGDLDLFAYFYVNQTGIVCTDNEATVTGYTFGGRPFKGSDMITVISRCQ